MAAHSTLRFSVIPHCQPTMHPLTESCTYFLLTTMRRCIFSSFLQFSVAYGATALIKCMKIGYHRQIVLQGLFDALRSSTCFGLAFSLTMGLTCRFRAALGSYKQWTAAFIPSIIGTWSFILENPKRWNIMSFFFGNSILETMIRASARELDVTLGPSVLMPLFMASSSMLLYLLRQSDIHRLIRGGDSPWFFYPPPLEEEDSKTTSDHSMTLQRQLKAAARLWGIGVALKMARTVAMNIFHPTVILNKIRRFNTHRLGLFFAGYVAIYAVCSWALECARGRDAAWHAAPAGLLAGAALYLYPDANFAVMPISVMLQILAKWYCNKKNVKKVLLWKFLFMNVTISYLVHAYLSNHDVCSKWIIASLDSFSDKIIPGARFRFAKIWATQRFPVLQAGL